MRVFRSLPSGIVFQTGLVFFVLFFFAWLSLADADSGYLVAALNSQPDGAGLEDGMDINSKCSLNNGCPDMANDGRQASSRSISTWSAIPETAMTDDGFARIIVKLHVKDIGKLTRSSASLQVPTADTSSAESVRKSIAEADAALSAAVKGVSNDVVNRLPDQAYRVNRQFWSIPFVALDVSPKGLEGLLKDPAVESIHPDIPVPLPEYDITKGNEIDSGSVKPSGDGLSSSSMFDTVGLIGADEAWAKGYTGQGWHVAVLDTGIKRTHEFFAGKDIVEACFSLAAHCPNRERSMEGTGAAVHYSSIYQGYDHGTHVTGTAVGKNPDNNLFGVAKDADVIAVNVFSMFSGDDCGSDVDFCIMSFSSDSMAGLEYVYSLRSEYNIGAVNMSLGGGKYGEYCEPIQKQAIANLEGANIPTSISTGNNGYCDGVGSPSCVREAIAVMASTKDDSEASFNNWHSIVADIFAPGVSIYSATGGSDSSYEPWNGTSMAAPHVAGGMTLMRQFKPVNSVEENFTLITANGKQIITLCPEDASKPRIYVNNFPQTGSLRVFIQPSEAVQAGAQWRRRGTITWFDSGAIETDVPVGDHIVEFRPVPGWRPDGTINVTVQSDETTQITAPYSEGNAVQPGVLMLLLDDE